jgi:hypothetical protein
VRLGGAVWQSPTSRRRVPRESTTRRLEKHRMRPRLHRRLPHENQAACAYFWTYLARRRYGFDLATAQRLAFARWLWEMGRLDESPVVLRGTTERADL